jgi:GH24 family phage-related lysozyme (muramidase)
MPINKIVATKRGKAAILSVVAGAVASAWAAFAPGGPDSPAEIRAAIAKGIMPPAVTLSIDKLIKPWEALRSRAYRDSVGVPTICWGETKGVKLGMVKSVSECEAMLKTRVVNDYYLPLVDKAKGFSAAPVSVQAAMISGAYNFGVGGQLKSTAIRKLAAGDFRGACEAQTAWNKANGKVLTGLVNRREMGDAQRLGEAELCVSGL